MLRKSRRTRPLATLINNEDIKMHQKTRKLKSKKGSCLPFLLPCELCLGAAFVGGIYNALGCVEDIFDVDLSI